MSRFSMCPSTIAVGNHPCPLWNADDAGRLLRLLVVPVKVGLLALLIAGALALTFQWSPPLTIRPGSAGSAPYQIHPAPVGVDDQAVSERVDAFLSQFEQRTPPRGGGSGPMEVYELP